MTEHERLEDVTGRIAVSQDRLTLTDDDTEARLYIKQKYDRVPLTTDETHLILSLSTDNGDVEIGLDGKQMDGLADAIYHIQEECKNDN